MTTPQVAAPYPGAMAPKQSDALKFIQGGFPFVILTVGGWLGISYTLQKRIDAQAGTGLGEGGGSWVRRAGFGAPGPASGPAWVRSPNESTPVVSMHEWHLSP